MKLGKRLFAWLLRQGDSFNHQLYDTYKENLFHDLRGQIVEVGPGTGVNLHYMPHGTKWIGIEPNEWFHKTLMAKAKEKGIEATLLSGNAAHIPLPDNSADIVLCTLVLCSVPKPADAIAEMKRVMKPGGKLIFIEHVAAPARSGLRLAQNISNPINRLVADGCNCNRETWKLINEGGFSDVQLSYQTVKAAMKIHSPHIMGFAMK